MRYYFTIQHNASFRLFILFMFSISVIVNGVEAQTGTASLKKYWLSNSGCAASFPSAPGQVDFNFDVDSNSVYQATVSHVANGVTYIFSVSAIQLREGAEADELDDKLTSYVDYVKSTQNVVMADGYKKINGITRGILAKGFSDTWRDHAENEYAVTAWMKGRTMVLMYVMGTMPYPEKAILNGFFNSFVFPSNY